MHKTSTRSIEQILDATSRETTIVLPPTFSL